jgi:hypothetical protein
VGLESSRPLYHSLRPSSYLQKGTPAYNRVNRLPKGKPQVNLEQTASLPVSKTCVFIVKMARPEGFEPPTLCSGGTRSIHLSYGRIPNRLDVSHCITFSSGRLRDTAIGHLAFAS